MLVVRFQGGHGTPGMTGIMRKTVMAEKGFEHYCHKRLPHLLAGVV